LTSAREFNGRRHDSDNDRRNFVYADASADEGSVFAVAIFPKAVTQNTPQLALVAGVSSLAALVLSRSGRIRTAMMLPLLCIIYAVLHLAVRSDGIQNIGLAILPVLILVGSLVLDRLTLVFFTASIILAVVGMLAIRYFVLLAERYSTNDMGDLFIFAVTCATAALVGRMIALRLWTRRDGCNRSGCALLTIRWPDFFGFKCISQW
jgi:hypothetical protein